MTATPRHIRLLASAYDYNPKNAPNTADASSISLIPDPGLVGISATGTSTARPTYETNELNGQPIARFDGTNDVLAFRAAIAINNGLSAYIVAKQNSLAQFGSVICGPSAGNLDLQFSQTTGKLAFVRSVTAGVLTQTTTPGAAAYHIWEAYFDGVSEHEIVMDSTSDGTASSAVTYGTVDRIGQNVNGVPNQWLNADVARLIIFPRFLGSADRAVVRAHLKALYNL